MGYLFLVVLTLALCSGFIVLTRYERGHSIRVLPKRRAQLDVWVNHTEFILTHVDLGAFVREEILRAGRHASHALVSLSLKVVRAAERLLTRMVRHLRTHAPEVTPPESTRPFVKTLSEFKDTLKSTPSDTAPF